MSKTVTAQALLFEVCDTIYRGIQAVQRTQYPRDIVSSEYCPDTSSYTLGEPVSSVAYVARDWLAHNLLRKYPGFDLGIDRHQVALDSYRANNARCKYQPIHFSNPKRSGLVERVGLLIHQILGDIRPVEFLNELRHEAGFSGGASVLHSRRSCSPENKFLSFSITEDVLPIFDALLGKSIWRDFLLSEGFQVEVVYGNYFDSVPKNAKTNRGICYEPEGNMYVQKAIGNIIRKRMLQYGVDLSYMDVTNSYLAVLGSENGFFSTIDSTSASDLWSREVIKELFWKSPEWFVLMDKSRSKRTAVLKKGGRNADYTCADFEYNYLFSSMGNGFTWELESLLFYCLSQVALDDTQRTSYVFTNEELCTMFKRHGDGTNSVAPLIWGANEARQYSTEYIIQSAKSRSENSRAFSNDAKRVARCIKRFRSSQIGIFGDDIVVPTESASTVKLYIRLLGGIPNNTKSYTRLRPGFRESCGVDALRGENITPFYVKDDVSSLTLEEAVPVFHKLVNQLGEWLDKGYADPQIYFDVLSVLFSVYGDPRFTRSSLCIGPKNFGSDACIWGAFGLALPTITRSSSKRGQRSNLLRTSNQAGYRCRIIADREVALTLSAYDQHRIVFNEPLRRGKTLIHVVADEGGYLSFLHGRKLERGWSKVMNYKNRVSRTVLIHAEHYESPAWYFLT